MFRTNFTIKLNFLHSNFHIIFIENSFHEKYETPKTALTCVIGEESGRNAGRQSRTPGTVTTEESGLPQKFVQAQGFLTPSFHRGPVGVALVIGLKQTRKTVLANSKQLINKFIKIYNYE